MLPQILAMLVFAIPWAFVTELPPEADGNAKVTQGGGALIVGFLLVFATLPIVWSTVGSIVGGTDGRREAAATSFSFSIACFFIPLVFSPLLGLQSPVRGYLVVWLAANLLAIVAIRNHDLFVGVAEVDGRDKVPQ